MKLYVRRDGAGAAHLTKIEIDRDSHRVVAVWIVRCFAGDLHAVRVGMEFPEGLQVPLSISCVEDDRSFEDTFGRLLGSLDDLGSEPGLQVWNADRYSHADGLPNAVCGH